MPDIKWVENHIEVTPPKRCKKITGTRFATILGLSPWATPFEMWCAITKTYEKPFEDTIYTVAGKVIEPKQAQYMVKSYAMYGLKTPTDIFGQDYFQKTYGDFFHDSKVFGGMWDYLLYEDGKPNTVLEMKTTKRAEDWGQDVPEYYALQAALYAYLLGVDDVIMVASFLDTKDYDNPDAFVPSVSNTITVSFKVSERYPDFPKRVKQAEAWWKKHVETGISPDFDEKRDAEILKMLRNNSLSPDTDMNALIAEAEGLKAELDAVAQTVEVKEKRLKDINDLIKKHAITQFRPGDKTVSVEGSMYKWVLTKTVRTDIDKDALKRDGLFEQYRTVKDDYRMTSTKIKEDK